MLDELAHIVMVVRDLAAYRALYGSELGLTELGCSEQAEGRRVCVYAIGPSMLELCEDPTAPVAIEDGAAETGEAVPPHPVVDHFALMVDSMTETFASLKSRRINFVADPAVTAVGHRNMQRALLTFVDPGGFHVQISETVDTRPHLEGRRAAKRLMADAGQVPPALFGGIDHISTYSADFSTTRAFYSEQLGLEEFFHSTAREAGRSVEPGFAQSAFAVGGTDVELATCASGCSVGPRAVRQLGFWVDDVDHARDLLRRRAVTFAGPPFAWTPVPDVCTRAFAICGPDGLRILIAERK